MTVYEIIGGVILLLAAIAIVVLTLSQRTKGQGLSSAINGGNSFMGDGRTGSADAKMAQLTKVCGIIFFVVALVACVLSSRLG